MTIFELLDAHLELRDSVVDDIANPICNLGGTLHNQDAALTVSWMLVGYYDPVTSWRRSNPPNRATYKTLIHVNDAGTVVLDQPVLGLFLHQQLPYTSAQTPTPFESVSSNKHVPIAHACVASQSGKQMNGWLN